MSGRALMGRREGIQPGALVRPPALIPVERLASRQNQLGGLPTQIWPVVSLRPLRESTGFLRGRLATRFPAVGRHSCRLS
jgi:hypothetical protein